MTLGATPSHSENPRRRPTAPIGLYDPAFEHDSCGVAFVARLDGIPSHETIVRALTALENLEHRGAAGADPLTGDGAGMLLAASGRVLPRRHRRGAAARRRLRRGRLLPSARTTRRAGPSSSRSSIDAVEGEGQRVIALARRPDGARLDRRDGPRGGAGRSGSSSSPPRTSSRTTATRSSASCT